MDFFFQHFPKDGEEDINWAKQDVKSSRGDIGCVPIPSMRAWKYVICTALGNVPIQQKLKYTQNATLKLVYLADSKSAW